MPFFSLVTFRTFSQSLTLFSHFLSIILKAKSTRMSKVTTHTKSYGPLSLEAEVEPKNPVDKYAVYIQKSGKVLGHLKKRATGKFKKAIFFFLRSNGKNNNIWAQMQSWWWCRFAGSLQTKACWWSKVYRLIARWIYQTERNLT